MSDTWTRELVWERYLGAFATLLRLPNESRARGRASAWPTIIRAFADAIAAEETRAEEAYPFPKGWDRPAPPSHRAIDLMEEVWDWHVKYLIGHPEEARMLVVMAWCRARHRPLTALFRSLRIGRRDAYRTRDRALDLVRLALTRDRVPANPFIELLVG